MNLKREKILENFNFDYRIYYHGESILVFPAYISETVVVLHYYDRNKKIWSKLDLYPIYQDDMVETLSKDFEIEEVFYDLQKKKKTKNLFVQFLAKRK